MNKQKHKISLGTRENPSRVEVWLDDELVSQVYRDPDESYESVRERARAEGERILLARELQSKRVVRYAQPVADMVAVEVERLPDGVGVLTLDLDRAVAEGSGTFVAWSQCPQVLELDGELFTKSGYDSDKLVGYYRTDRRAAVVR